MDITEVKERAFAFSKTMEDVKREPVPFPWYPYSTLSNFVHLERLFTGDRRGLLDEGKGRSVLDIGCADGDLSFFLETLGYEVEAIDHAPTNMNGLQGFRTLKERLNSSAVVHDVNLDSQFTLPRPHYRLVFFLGILYHLQNPYYALRQLAGAAEYCFVSTRITRLSADRKTDLSGLPVAYLLDEKETNNDPTNYWIFTETGLRRILARTGWEVCDYLNLGNTVDSDPVGADKDERAFCLLRSLRHAR